MVTRKEEEIRHLEELKAAKLREKEAEKERLAQETADKKREEELSKNNKAEENSPAAVKVRLLLLGS